MKAKKINVTKTLIFFLFSHLIIWTFIPSISNSNLPLDTIEALAWGSNLDWGFNKHPPVSAFAVETFYQIFGKQDWVYYFLSQLFVISAFFVVWLFSKDFFEDDIYSLISIFLLEGIYFYNFTTPEFNVNVCQLPFWALTVFYCWRGIKYNKIFDWLLFGLFAALGILSKYLFIYLLLAIDIFFIYLLTKEKINYKVFISLLPFFLVLLPHLIWLVNNDYVTFKYALLRTETEDVNFFYNHFLNPLIFLGKQVGLLIPFFIMLAFIVSNLKIKIRKKSKEFLFLLIINFIPIILIVLTSIFMGVKIRTMWMTPFYLFFGVMFVYVFKKRINTNKIKNFIIVFLVMFIFSPFAYFYISISKNDKRTDYPGKEIAEKVETKFGENFTGKVAWILGDEWHGGNLSYHLKSRPKWYYILNDKNEKKVGQSSVGSITTIGVASNEISKQFSEICENKNMNGKFYIIKGVSICMNGIKK